MTRDDDRNGVAAVGGADGLGQVAVAEGPGEIPVAAGLAIRDGAEQVPDPLLERVAARGQRQVEVPKLTGEIRAQLHRGRGERLLVRRGLVAEGVSVSRAVLRRVHEQVGQCAILRNDRELPDGGGKQDMSRAHGAGRAGGWVRSRSSCVGTGNSAV
jgi:hypothetical protein